MQIVNPTCAGIDVHKKEVKVCLVWRDPQGQRQQEVRSYRTMMRDLLQMHDWLVTRGCPVVAMESTGVYWKPLYNLLEGG